MRRHLLVAGVLVLLAAALVQPAVAQNETGDNQTAPPEDNETEEENETEEDEEPENETEQENETRGPPDDVPQGESAQFDARLMTAINTVDTLTEIAPNDDVEQRLERALEILRGVQEDTDTASLGHEDEDHNHSEEEESREQQERQGPPEDRGPSGQRGPQNRGQQGGGPPGFVSNLLGGLFG